ncbi:hypothetical protein [Sphingobacterium cellulitidis]|uniref:hypothetical protein n=1 Tax=Sphingobacterium cellulitidis TaxID=1768011 RepID=UPI0011819140|nr:hypothetical protein [Sphingobacterium cellulitidis]
MEFKKLITAGLFFTLIIACNNSSSDKSSSGKKNMELAKINILTFLKSKLENPSDGGVIDSIKILKIDTLNEKLDSMTSVYSYLNRVNLMSSYREEILQDMRSDKDMVRFAKELGQNYDVFKNSFDRKKKTIDELGVISERLMSHVKFVDSLVKKGHLDTLKTTGYLFCVKVFAKDKNMTNQDIDSVFIPLDGNFLINEKSKRKSEFNPEN